jgi:flavin-dependent dehydrogenase
MILLGLIENHEFNGRGYSYFLRSNVRKVRRGNAFITGDAAGLATLDMGEGIAPAIESGLLAARAIAYGENYSLAKIGRYSFPAILFARKYLRNSEFGIEAENIR